MTNISVEIIHPASIRLDNKVNKYVNRIREKYVGGSNEQPFFSKSVASAPTSVSEPVTESSPVSSITTPTVDNKNENGSRFYYLSALTSLGIQFGTIVYWYFRS
jgi:hypothetical protein